MKRILILFLWLGLIYPSRSQTPAVTFCVSSSQMSILYKGLENPLTIAVAGVPTDKLKVSISEGTITGENGKFKVDVTGLDSKEVTLKISSELKPGVVTELGTKTFRVRQIPKPEAMLAGLTGGSIGIDDVSSLDSVYINLPNFVYEGIRYRVTKYKFAYAPKQGMPTMLDGTGGKISPDMKATMSSPSKNDKIVISDIYCQLSGTEKEIRLSSNIILTVQ